MRLLLILSLIFALGTFSFSQETRLLESFEQAEQLAKSANIPIVIYFSGSDWCKPCIKLKKDILMSNEFAVYSKELALYVADFPFRKKQSKELKKVNEVLAEKYNSKGIFPNLVVLNPGRKIIYQVGYKDQSPGEFIAEMKKGISSASR